MNSIVHGIHACTMLSLVYFLAAYACNCSAPGVFCTEDCSSTFCLCDAFYNGVIMNTSVGTRCSAGALVHDSQCMVPTGCACQHVGVNCLSNSHMCLCDERLVGTIETTANNTVCVDDRLAWVTDLSCTNNGFYCTSPCSVSYYYCTNNRRMPAQFVPAGTVCDSTGGEGFLVTPDNCSYTSVHASCPTEDLTIQCTGRCSTSFYHCNQHTAYAVQSTPVGLVCYNNAFILGSDPVCAEGMYQTFPVIVDYSNETIPVTVLYQYALASALAEAISYAGVPVVASDVYIGGLGRRLAVSEQLLSVQSSDTSLAGVVAHAMQDLPNILTRDNLVVRVWLQESLTPTSSPLPVANAVANADANAVAFPLMSGAIPVGNAAISTILVILITVLYV